MLICIVLRICVFDQPFQNTSSLLMSHIPITIPEFADIMFGNTSGPRQNGRHFADDIFKCIILNEDICISLGIWLKFVPKGQINKIPDLVQIMAWRRSSDKPLFETMTVSLLMHICATGPQWVIQLPDDYILKFVTVGFTMSFFQPKRHHSICSSTHLNLIVCRIKILSR